jgi:DNA-binding LacI/PurR family transcriptional regulator
MSSNNKVRPLRMIDIARRANVSRTAVTHVLTGAGRGKVGGVSKKKAEQIRQIAAELGYVPNLAAQQLAGKRSGIVGAIASQWWSTETRFFSVLQQACAAQGLDILAMQANDRVDSIERSVETWLGRGVEAVILLAFVHDAFWSQAADLLARFPRVISVVVDPGINESRAVESDIVGGMRLAVEHLLNQGRRKIVCLLEDLDSKMNCLRHRAFVAVMDERRRPVEANQLCLATKGWSDENYPQFQKLCEEMLLAGADAIIADSDFSAAFLCKALLERGLRIPRDVAVVGWGNEVVSRWGNPRLTTVSYEFETIVEKCLALLGGWPEDGAAAPRGSCIVPMKLVVREST